MTVFRYLRVRVIKKTQTKTLSIQYERLIKEFISSNPFKPKKLTGKYF